VAYSYQMVEVLALGCTKVQQLTLDRTNSCTFCKIWLSSRLSRTLSVMRLSIASRIGSLIAVGWCALALGAPRLAMGVLPVDRVLAGFASLPALLICSKLIF